MAESKLVVYVSHAERSKSPYGEIFVYKLNPASGELSLVQQVATPGKAMPMAITPDRRFLYVSLRTEPFTLASYAIDAMSGKLVHLATTPISGSMAWLSTDRTGRFLFASAMPDVQYSTIETEPRNSVISVSAIGAHGFLQPEHQVIRSEPYMHSILTDPANRYVIAMSRNADLILRYGFDANTGMLSPDGLAPVRVKPKAGPRHFLFHPNNCFLYLLNEADASLYVFRYDANNGSLHELQIASAVPADFDDKKPHAADLHITPDGRFLYASERHSNTLALFKVDLANGLLTPAGTFPTEEWPRGFNIDPYGRYLLCAGQLSNHLTCHAIDRESGKLTKVGRYPMGRGPNWVEIVRLP